MTKDHEIQSTPVNQQEAKANNLTINDNQNLRNGMMAEKIKKLKITKRQSKYHGRVG